MRIYPVIMLRYPFEITRVGDECIAVGVEEGADAFHGIIKLENESAVFMMKKLQEGITLPELIAACMNHFEDSKVEDVGPKVMEFLDQLKEKKLLAVDPSRGVKDSRE